MYRRAAVFLAVAWVAIAGGASAESLDAALGERLLRRPWIGAGASTQSADGLGPLYNARACTGCHDGADGRGAAENIVLRLLHPAGGDPIYGRQIQVAALPGLAPEATATIRRRVDRVSFTLSAFSHGPLDRTTIVSPRLPPALRGLGLIEAVPEAAIRAAADPDDRNGDGVRGVVAAAQAGDEGEVGRFGWKGEHATLPDQVAAAFSLDLGLSTHRFPEPWGDCSAAEADCRAAPHGDAPREGPEVHPRILAAIVAHLRVAAMPPATTSPSEKARFAATGCAVCHTVEQVAVIDGAPRRFAPYTDLLLHDMGPGLADAADVAAPAAARLWRTAPLWGLGVAVRGGGGLLHDGRARTVREAIRWHDGEASAARRRFERMSPSDQEVLIRFLEKR
jgi:CxxC motif-containing protein (DUF1111 family)